MLSISTLSQIACNLLGNVYAAYASYSAVLSGDPQQHKQWLSYWIVNAVFVVFELIGDTFISWLPMYYELKLGLVVWLTLYNGATIMYDRLVHRYIVEYEPEIDAKVAEIQAGANRAVDNLAGGVMAHVRKQSVAILAAGTQFLTSAAVASLEQQQLQMAQQLQQQQQQQQSAHLLTNRTGHNLPSNGSSSSNTASSASASTTTSADSFDFNTAASNVSTAAGALLRVTAESVLNAAASSASSTSTATESMPSDPSEKKKER